MVEKNEENLSKLVKVELTAPHNFVKVKNLLRRIGINPKGTKNLYRTCHIYRRGNDFYICHFKELFWLDGRENGMDDLDRERRNRIVAILVERQLVTADLSNFPFGQDAIRSVRIAPYSEVESWKLYPKYRLRSVKEIEPKDGSIR